MAAVGTARPPRPTTVLEDRPGFAAAILFAAIILVAALGTLGAFAPEAALKAFGITCVLVLCAVRVDAAVMLLVATAPLEFFFESNSSGPITVTKIVGVLAFGSFAFHALTSRRRLHFDGMHGIVFLLLALAMVSTLQAEEPGAAVSTTLRYASFVALFFVVSQFAGDRAMYRKIVWALSIAATISAGFGIYYLLIRYQFQATIKTANANDFAFIIATTLPLTFWLLRDHRILRIPIIAMIAVMSAAVFLSFSRGALVGLAAGAFWHIVTERRQTTVLLGGLVIAVAATFLLIRADPAQVEEGFKRKQLVASANVETRLEAWGAAVNLASDRPLGVGPGNFRYHWYEATGNPPGTRNLLVVHNAYLDVAAELGVVAMVLFLVYLIAAFTRLHVVNRRGVGPPGLPTAIRTSLVVATVAALFLSEQYFAPFWLLGGLAAALWHQGLSEREQATAGPHRLTPQTR